MKVGPNKEVRLRFKTRKQVEDLIRAAKKQDVSVNKYAIRVLDRAVKADIQPPALQQETVA